jgi:hypothetical protein
VQFLRAFVAGAAVHFLRAYSGGTFGAEEGLVAVPFWRDHEASMTSSGSANRITEGI